MAHELPKIAFKSNFELDIEVMTFSETFQKLNQSNNHNPFIAHRILFHIILIVTKKSYSHFVDFKSYNLIEGSAIFIAKNQVHHFTKKLIEADGFCIIFNSKFVDKSNYLISSLNLNRLFNYHIESPVIHQKDMNNDNLVSIATRIREEYQFSNNFAKSEILGNLLHVLLLKAERSKEFQSIKSTNNHWLEKFNAFKNMLEKEYTNTRSSRHYASNLFVSYKFLNDIVKNLTGKTVKTFIDDFVTIEIKRYLVSTSLSIKEISYKTGFEEPANMVKFFKKKTNSTPLKFRQQK
ncbi:AraC family transcriptional regulator [uncultured Algibacter sp.]|uniref:helix-turn-helix domain-containing protein n=1 Tax=uncultured Algibacter sp. TaxID=298659 RepID=UPI002618B06F|nr:helix-turn-helix domain-containing protein [uncultured Algibacter sp.]